MPNEYTYTLLNHFQPKNRLVRGRTYLRAKRITDLVVVIATLPLWLPLSALIYLIIRASAPDAFVIFVQKRTGKNGKRFLIYKFRTMVPNAEELKSKLAAVNGSGDLAGPLKLANDPRITRIGRFLRKTSLDELPQLVNILRGEMSLVGPRPTSWSPESYKLWQTERLDVLPGLTGLWQIYGRGGQDFDEWLRWDIRYLENQCLSLDFIIMIKTFTAVFKQRGAM
jgi:lipopolysaccharide/colanic/teichoic acid biosynthesis glycosyltransferase